MASDYTGNPNATEVPSPAPGPGVIPKKSIPAGTDALSIESITQDMKVDADFIGHIQSAVRLDTPVVSGDQGFTAVTYNGFGTGTLTPSNAKIAAGLRVVVKIVTPGAAGVATYVISTDGGATFSSVPQTSGTPAVDTTTGIWLTFGAGTFNTDGTASFRSGHTPQAVWSDALGHARFAIDRNGHPVGARPGSHLELWQTPVAAPTTGQIAGSNWMLHLDTGSVLTVEDPTTSYNSRFVQLAPSSTSGLSTYLYGPTLCIANTSFMSLVMEFEVGMNAALAGTASNVSMFCGLATTTDPFAGGFPNNAVALYKTYNVADWYMQGTTTNLTSAAPSSGSAPVDRVKIEVQGSASAGGVYQAIFQINGNIIGTLPAAVMPGAVALRPALSLFNEGGAPSGSPLAFVGSIRCYWNIYENADTI